MEGHRDAATQIPGGLRLGTRGGLDGIPVHVFSKRGVVGPTSTDALEPAQRGIRVNAVCPAAIDTKVIQRSPGGDPEALKAMYAMKPIWVHGDARGGRRRHPFPVRRPFSLPHWRDLSGGWWGHGRGMRVAFHSRNRWPEGTGKEYRRCARRRDRPSGRPGGPATHLSRTILPEA